MITKEQVREIVRRTISSYLAQNSSKQLVVLLISRTQLQEQVLESVLELARGEFKLILVTCRDWSDKVEGIPVAQHIKLEELSGDAEQALLQKLTASDALILPNLSLAMLAKLALTIDDTLAAWLTIQTQLMGKTIIVAADNLDGDIEQLLATPVTVEQRVAGYLQQLQRDGIKVTTLKRLTQTVKANLVNASGKRPILLAKHVEKSMQKGVKEITLPENTLVTPLAKDTSKELRVSLTKQRKGGLNDSR